MGMWLTAYALAVAAAAFELGPQSRTIWDGVYTDAQARRGQQAYGRSCAGCHRDDLRGGPEGEPALRGVNFTSNWSGKTAAALFDAIATNMPKNNPGALTFETYGDILSFLLKANGAPSGHVELPADTQVLDRILFTALPPPH